MNVGLECVAVALVITAVWISFSILNVRRGKGLSQFERAVMHLISLLGVPAAISFMYTDGLLRSAIVGGLILFGGGSLAFERTIIRRLPEYKGPIDTLREVVRMCWSLWHPTQAEESKAEQEPSK